MFEELEDVLTPLLGAFALSIIAIIIMFFSGHQEAFISSGMASDGAEATYLYIGNIILHLIIGVVGYFAFAKESKFLIFLIIIFFLAEYGIGIYSAFLTYTDSPITVYTPNGSVTFGGTEPDRHTMIFSLIGLYCSGKAMYKLFTV